MPFSFMLFLLWSLAIFLPVVPTEALCSDGLNYSAVLRDFGWHVNEACKSELNTVKFVLNRSRYSCCAFDYVTCKNAKEIYEYFYIEKNRNPSVHNMCFYNFFIAFYILCDCKSKIVTSAPPTRSPSCGTRVFKSFIASPVSPFIIGGENAKQCEFPWTAFYHVGFYRCAAVLFDSRHVLTVAHCAKLAEKDQMTIGLGSIDMEHLARMVGVEKVIIHPEFGSNQFGLYNDIAILKLSEEIEFTDCIQPICLPGDAINNMEACITAGWGKDGSEGNLQRFLQKVSMPILDERECQRYVKGYRAGQLCAGHLQGGQDSCQGDSGGPLMCPVNGKWVLAGLVSFGKYCALPYSPGVYTDVRYYMTWILNNIN